MAAESLEVDVQGLTTVLSRKKRSEYYSNSPAKSLNAWDL
jgi:hypothetical protein